MCRQIFFLLVPLLATVFMRPALAIPIDYTSLIPGTPTVGSIVTTSVFDAPDTAAYFSFAAMAGEAVEIIGNRLENTLDMAFWVYEGLFADTDDFGPTFDVGFIIFGDDEDPPNLSGPFGDPHVVFMAPGSGFYTVAVVSFTSSGDSNGDGRYDFDITFTKTPEPASLLLLGSGMVGLLAAGWLRRRC